MAIHGSTRTEPHFCTVKRLIELLEDIAPEALVYCAVGEDEDGPQVGSLLLVTEIRDPFDQADQRVALIVPNGALGEASLRLLSREEEKEEASN